MSLPGCNWPRILPYSSVSVVVSQDTEKTWPAACLLMVCVRHDSQLAWRPVRPVAGGLCCAIATASGSVLIGYIGVELQPFRAAPPGVRSVAWSPEGQQIAFAAGNEAVIVDWASSASFSAVIPVMPAAIFQDQTFGIPCNQCHVRGLQYLALAINGCTCNFTMLAVAD